MTDTSQFRASQPGVHPHGLANSQAVRTSAPFGGEDQAVGLEKLRIATTAGGLVFIGPTAEPLMGLDALIAAPEVEAIEMSGKLLSSWISSPDEVLLATRQASSVIRSGRTAVIYLDSHREAGVPVVDSDDWDFVCGRLGRIMVGLADAPAYIAVHGEQMAYGLFDAVGDVDHPTIGAIAEELPVVQLSSQSMCPNVPVAIAPTTSAATAVVYTVDWFEARRF